MNPLAGLDIIFEMFGKTEAFTKKREAELANMSELERSAAMEEQNATMTRVRGGLAAGRRRMAASALGATQKVAYAMGSIDSTSGTAAATSSSSAIFAELDATTLQNNAVREAFGHEESARRYRTEAKKLRDYYLAPDSAGMAPADAEFGAQLAASALGGAAKFGMGGK